jgi:CDP-paratose 2-epimerase
MKIVVTGGAGFIGSHVSEYYARNGHEVTVIDNLSRASILGKKGGATDHNWNFLSRLPNIKLVKKDIRQPLEEANDADAIIHTAAQTAVTSSLTDPRTDFEINAVGTFNVLEAARNSPTSPTVVFCSTNKVYGDNVNELGIKEGELKYEFSEMDGVKEALSTDLCKHTPYGSSKFAADIYAQDYAKVYGLKTGVFRMSCIYGTRQFGVEDQGWVAWFVIASLLNKPITIFGDGKQVRDVLYVEDLVRIYDAFINSPTKHGVYNTGGGPENTLSLLELLNILEKETGNKIPVSYSDWRPSDQKVYISDISKARSELSWEPKIAPEEGVKRLTNWVRENISLFSE